MMGSRYKDVLIVTKKGFKPHLQTLTLVTSLIILLSLSQPHDDFTTLEEVKIGKQNLAQILIEAIIQICMY